MDGDVLLTFRSPASLRDGCPPELSFGEWTESDPLPPHDDDVEGFNLASPPGSLVQEPQDIQGLPYHVPNHPGFPPSAVCVPIPSCPSAQLSNNQQAQGSVNPTAIPPTPQQGNEMTSDGVSNFSIGYTRDPDEPSQNPNQTTGGSAGLPARARTRLGITLTFPDGKRCDQRYCVSMQLAVPSLLRTTSPVVLFVGPTWGMLDHDGVVVDRFFPGTSIPCPFLIQNSVVRVRKRASLPVAGDKFRSGGLRFPYA
jgi:hypothetical protein